MRTPETAELLTPAEVSALFGVDAKTVGRWGESGRLVSVMTGGGHHRYFAAEVRALLAGETPEAARKIGLAEKARLTGRPG